MEIDVKEFILKNGLRTCHFVNLYKSSAKYKTEIDGKKYIIHIVIDYRSDLDYAESLNSLDCEAEINEITLA
tara:strand:+ start:467 stop:682 length:216 start_codon:yes stop_codon:yes gene_type:complete